MSFMNKSPRRVWDFHPRSFGLRLAGARLHALVGGAKPIRMLLVSDGAAHTSEQQFAPIGRHAGALRRRFGLVSQYRKLPQGLALSANALRRFDIVGLKLLFQTPTAEVERIVTHFKSALAGSNTRFVYFDGDDDLNVQYHAAIEAADLYVKKHVFADESAYQREYLGKGNLTDHVARGGSFSFADNIIPTSGQLPAHLLPKLHLGWNIGLDDKIFEFSRRVDALPHPPRDIDLSCRAYVQPSVWTHALRGPVLERMEALGTKFRILAPRDRVSQDKYYEEMLRSKICISPFGFGELCWRDFEAILCGCLLVKPDMGHAKTQPDLFVPGVTYVPVRWDYSDLEEQCSRYLQDDAARQRIVEQARSTLLKSLEADWFVARFGELLGRLGFAAGTTLADTRAAQA
jgi:hypothetical protein